MHKIFFKIDGHEYECLVIDENKEKAIENIKRNYFGVEDEFTIYPITARTIIELKGNF